MVDCHSEDPEAAQQGGCREAGIQRGEFQDFHLSYRGSFQYFNFLVDERWLGYQSRMERRSLGSVISTEVIPSVDSQHIRVKSGGQKKKKLLISESLCHVTFFCRDKKKHLITQMNQQQSKEMFESKSSLIQEHECLIQPPSVNIPTASWVATPKCHIAGALPSPSSHFHQKSGLVYRLHKPGGGAL